MRLLGNGQAERLRGLAYKPVAILNEIRRELVSPQYGVHASGTKLWMLDAQINELGKIVGGCERIASTPIPFAYNVLLHRTVYAYCVLLPFGLVDSAWSIRPSSSHPCSACSSPIR